MPILILIAVILAASLGALFFFSRQAAVRQAKSFERGLKMVPLRIDLPPISDDVKGEKDGRDVADESISRALSLYEILASVYQKKIGPYGQRHIAIEIIAHESRIYFYVAAPSVLRHTVEQAVLSSYPTATISEAAEHNIFSPVGKIEGTYGGELVMKEDYSRPIATFSETRKDSMVGLLNSFSALKSGDGMALQILIRPADPSWRKHVEKEVKNKKDNKKTGLSALKPNVGDVIGALSTAPEAKKDEKDKDLSGTVQDLVKAMEQKIKHPGFETTIRVVASSDKPGVAQASANSMAAVFSIFNAQGRNGFKFVPAKDMESFIDSYVLRMFPHNSRGTILNAEELATIFHLPDQRNIPTSKLKKSSSKTTDAPTDIMDEGVLLGYNIFRGEKTPIYLSDNDRRRHIYIIGQTGTGKSVFMENIATQDIMAGKGFAYIDPHGDGANYLMSVIPPERVEDVVYFCPADMDYPMGLNLFEFHNEDQKDFLIQESINMLYKLYDPNQQGIVGPRMETIFRNCAKALMADPAGGTFIEVPKILSDQNFLNSKLKHVEDKTVIDYWTKEVPNSKRSNDYGEVVSWVSSKFGAFLSNTMMRNIIGQTKSAFNLREIMDNNKILIVNLSKGRTGDLNSKLIGMVFVMKFQAAAMSRADIPESERKDFTLYVDEFQNFSTDSFATILSEARKFRLNLIVANQFTSQLNDDIRGAVFGNVGSIVSFRVGADDADHLVKQLQPTFSAEDLVNIPNFNTATRLMINNIPSQPFSMGTIPPLGNPSQEVREALMQYSAVKYGRPRKQVEDDIFSRIYGNDDSSASSGGGAKPAPASPQPNQAPVESEADSPVSSWLKQRRNGAQAPAATPAASSVQTAGPAASSSARSGGGLLGGWRPSRQPASGCGPSVDSCPKAP